MTKSSDTKTVDLAEDPLFRLLEAPAAALSFTPRLIEKVSAWWQHVPFAFWLTTVARPGVFVELGSHNGASYAAFCEAVMRGRLATQCFAVDTWKGDPQAGFYDESAYTDLAALNEELYGSFSQLLRMTFDEALTTFADGSVDLLHIDGLHTFEAVSHDFETWRPKLSDRGVVLFHDTNVHKSDFGVGRLFHGLAQQYPSFEFLHGHGLGVLAVGARPPSVIAALCSGLADETTAAIRDHFFAMGRHWSDANFLHAETGRARSESDDALKEGLAERDRAQASRRELTEHVFRHAKAAASATMRAGKRRFRRGEEALDAALVRESVLFDADWYRDRHADVTGDPAEHYIKVGASAGIDPSRLFSGSRYLEAVGLEPGGANPLLHFLKYGDLDDFNAALSAPK